MYVISPLSSQVRVLSLSFDRGQTGLMLEIAYMYRQKLKMQSHFHVERGGI